MAYDGITIATGIAYSKVELKKLNDLTYLFDPTWVAGGDARAGANTLPMALFHITSLDEVMESQITSQQMILYKSKEASTSTGGSNLDTGQIETIADNNINKPKQYNVEAILPNTYSSLIGTTFNSNIFTEMVSSPYQLANSMNDYNTIKFSTESILDAASSITQASLSVMEKIVGIATEAVSVLKTLVLDLDILSQVSEGTVLDYINSALNGSYYNVNSLEAMWLNRSLLKLKLADSWEYKTVCIKSCRVSKSGVEEGCKRISLVLQEMPIMLAGYYNVTVNLEDTNNKAIQSKGRTLAQALSAAGTDTGYTGVIK